MSLHIVGLTTPERRICPYCGSHDVHRSRKRGIIETMLTITDIRPYRCHYCERRHLGYCRSTLCVRSAEPLSHPAMQPRRSDVPCQPGLFDGLWSARNQLNRKLGGF
jgi:hypothetical protein